jgi:hypothetical protein
VVLRVLFLKAKDTEFRKIKFKKGVRKLRTGAAVWCLALIFRGKFSPGEYSIPEE